MICYSYRLYLDRLEQERQSADEVTALHMRTIQALVRAIEAKDHGSLDPSKRVETYVVELGRKLGMTPAEREALRAAALLYDIGKLAVPEHILSKPGTVTVEEFERIKVHAAVGAEILERVQFPYPVVPIVRAHHERWDGTGYPSGLAGEAIPMGARVLAAVDCLNALACDRRHRKGLPLEEAVKIVRSQSGKAFDPKVVELLASHYAEWEQQAQTAGLEQPSQTQVPEKTQTDVLGSIAAARQEVQALFEISQELGSSLSLDETLSVLAVRLGKLVPHHAAAIWVRKENVLVPEYVNGEDYRLLASLEIPVGTGLSGAVAETRKPVLNGDASAELVHSTGPSKLTVLCSAVSVPLEGSGGLIGVLTLYHSVPEAFTKDQLRILLATSGKIANAIENALRFRQAESSAAKDYLTNLPNARSLFLQLDAETARARRSNQPLAVVVMDLDGFKGINDRYGHLEGNKALSAVASVLKAACREYDYVARMGGDEFVVLLPGAKPEDAAGKATLLQALIADAAKTLPAGASLSASIGIAHFPVDGSESEELLAAADQQMYRQKTGRRTPALFAGTADWNTATIQ